MKLPDVKLTFVNIM